MSKDFPGFELLPAEPKAPSWQEMATAIRTFASELSGLMQEDDQVTDADRVLLGLADRLGASVAHEKPLSEPATAEAAPIDVSSDQGPLACDTPLRDELQEITNSYINFRRALRDLLHRHGVASNPMWSDDEIVVALARSVLGVGAP